MPAPKVAVAGNKIRLADPKFPHIQAEVVATDKPTWWELHISDSTAPDNYRLHSTSYWTTEQVEELWVVA